MTFDLNIDAIAISEIPAALAQLAAYQAQLAARLMVPAPEPEADEDKLLTAGETCAVLRRSAKWLSRNRKRLPFAVRLGPRSWTYSEKKLRRWLARQKS
jgi:predicted DNA-binding transcriptional regulator AlpA